MYFIVVSFCWLSAAQPAQWIVHPIVVGAERKSTASPVFSFNSSPPRKETAFRLLPSQGKRLLIGSTGLRKPPQPATQIRTGRSTRENSCRVPRASEGHR